MKPWLAVLLVAAGCYAPNLDAGHFQCGANDACPPGHHCATDGHCWKDGTDPTPPDLPPSADLSAPPDLTAAAQPDLAGSDAAPDLEPAPDLAPYVVPPQSLWLSSGGGSGTGASTSDQLNASFGGASFVGTSTATSGATVTFGYFCDDTFQ